MDRVKQPPQPNYGESRLPALVANDVEMKAVEVWEVSDTSDDEADPSIKNEDEDMDDNIEEDAMEENLEDGVKENMEEENIGDSQSSGSVDTANDEGSMQSLDTDEENMSSENDYDDYREPTSDPEVEPQHPVQTLEEARTFLYLESLAHIDYESEDDNDVFAEADDEEETRRTVMDALMDGDGADYYIPLVDESSDVHSHSGSQASSNCSEDAESSEDDTNDIVGLQLGFFLDSDQEVEGTEEGKKIPLRELQRTKYTEHKEGKSREFHCRYLQDEIKDLEADIEDKQSQLDDRRQELSEMERDQEIAEVGLKDTYSDSGIPWQLFTAYEAFCKSLEPQFGQRGGFSITLERPHNGSYAEYDPKFMLFKNNVELSYDKCHYRCEASTPYKPQDVDSSSSLRTVEYVVEFWPIKSPEPFTGFEVTWGDQYPELYICAKRAAFAGSVAALDMLVALPDERGIMESGWMFEYEFEPSLWMESVKGKRWVYRRAYLISNPIPAGVKRRSLMCMLRLPGSM